MFQIQDLRYFIGERDLLSGISWTIPPGKRVALVGANGAGKTTLFKIINKEIKPFGGNIISPKNFRIGYLPQEEIAIDKGSVLQIVLEGQQDVLQIENKMKELHQLLDSSDTDQEKILKQLSRLEEQYETLDGYRLESLAKSILAGLGFQATDFTRPLSDFSGGWRMRSYLARLLIQKPDLLLLDEPTNHLDLESLEWLEQYLLNFAGSMIIVSHDRFFIDRLAQEIYELNRGKLEHYAGNYHFYEQERTKREELLQKKWEMQRLERARQEKFINRFRYKATKAVQVQSRIKKLEKMEEIILPPAPKTVHFNLKVEIQSYKDVLSIQNASFKYDNPWVLKNINLKLYRGDKVALVGVNGAGKTTLTRLIAKEFTPTEGSVETGKNTHIGYYAQHQIDSLDLNSTIHDEVASHISDIYFPRIRDILGIFQFSGDDIHKKIEVLSGGEKARVSLAKIMLSRTNFLIMDEPTNHLDITSKEALEHALSTYDGTLLLISHDRYFLDKLVHRVIEIKDHHLKEYEGNYSDYLNRRESESETMPAQAENNTKHSSPVRKTKDQKRKEAEARQEISKERNQLQKDIDSLEIKIEQLEIRKSEIEQELSEPSTYQNGERAASLQKEFSQVKEDLQNYIDTWESQHLRLEELLSKLS